MSGLLEKLFALFRGPKKAEDATYEKHEETVADEDEHDQILSYEDHAPLVEPEKPIAERE